MPLTISHDDRSRVGIFDAQDERAAVAAGEQPVEKGRSGATDVEVAGGRGREPDARGGSSADHANAIIS